VQRKPIDPQTKRQREVDEAITQKSLTLPAELSTEIKLLQAQDRVAKDMVIALVDTWPSDDPAAIKNLNAASTDGKGRTATDWATLLAETIKTYQQTVDAGQDKNKNLEKLFDTFFRVGMIVQAQAGKAADAAIVMSKYTTFKEDSGKLEEVQQSLTLKEKLLADTQQQLRSAKPADAQTGVTKRTTRTVIMGKATEVRPYKIRQELTAVYGESTISMIELLCDNYKQASSEKPKIMQALYELVMGSKAWDEAIKPLLNEANKKSALQRAINQFQKLESGKPSYTADPKGRDVANNDLAGVSVEVSILGRMANFIAQQGSDDDEDPIIILAKQISDAIKPETHVAVDDKDTVAKTLSEIKAVIRGDLGKAVFKNKQGANKQFEDTIKQFEDTIAIDMVALSKHKKGYEGGTVKAEDLASILGLKGQEAAVQHLVASCLTKDEIHESIEEGLRDYLPRVTNGHAMKV
jgi:hypothetical protein